MAAWIKIIFFTLIVRPLVLIILGLNVRGRENLPTTGPCVIVANHNSHLDTLVLMSLFRLRDLPCVKPLAAADYFLHGTKFLRWFALNCIGVIPLERSGGKTPEDNFRESFAALERGEILLLFPEGSRGSPEQMGRLKKGVFHLLKNHPDIPIVPIRLYGLGKALPKGEALFVPFNCDVAIGEKFYCRAEVMAFMQTIDERFNQLTNYLTRRNTELHEETTPAKDSEP